MFKKIINTCLLACLLFVFAAYNPKDAFKNAQLKSARVKQAYETKWPSLEKALVAKHIDQNNFDIYLRAFKQENMLELWVKNKSDQQFVLLKTIAICAKSGSVGPKRRQGDGQVPEGFYEISAFNPASNYHLSLKVSYPNKSDRLKTKGDPGGDIMIHGNCVTIGCIPIEDDPIEEVYVLCVEAKNRGRIIHTDIYPCRFSDASGPGKNADAETLRFWNSMKEIYKYFEKNRQLPEIVIDMAGNYTFVPGKL